MMKTQLIAIALFGATAAAVGLYPAYQSNGTVTTTHAAPPVVPIVNERPIVEVVFALDTTGSMSGLIQAAKEKIWSIASTMAQAQNAPEIRMGLVAYRDRGDAYVTRVVDLSSDLDQVYATLMDFQADGGGDTPESVNEALYDAVHEMSWSRDKDAYRVVFLVGDAPAHMDYQDDVKYTETLAAARQRGIVVNAIQCGEYPATTGVWQQIASLGAGRFFNVEQSGSAVAMATPFDGELARLSAELDGTRLYYGSEEDKKASARKVAATEKLHAGASVASRARRAEFNTSASGETNLFGKGDLVADIAAGRVDLDEVAPASLPAPMQEMAPEEQRAAVAELAEKREVLKAQISELADQRRDFMRQKLEESGGAKGSLDDQLYEAVRDQAKERGIVYEAEAPAY